jgi:SAM-dependent methyltransferase
MVPQRISAADLVFVLKRLVPAHLRALVRTAWHATNYRGREFECPVCETGLAYFQPLGEYYFAEWDRHQYIHSIFAEETLNVRQFLCPHCKATDRDRLSAVYCRSVLLRATAKAPYRVIEFAPSVPFSAFLRRHRVSYRSADLNDPNADDRVDLADMRCYADNSVDLFLCSHVLEHVQDDQRAIQELYRILAPGGHGIVLSPINLALDDVYENPAVTSEAGRWKHFGQHDHVRVYSKNGFVQRLHSAGFEVSQLGITHFGAATFTRHGIHPRSVLYVVAKKPTSHV